MMELSAIRTIDRARWLRPPDASTRLRQQFADAADSESSNLFTTGAARWPAGIAVRLRLADPVRQAAKRRRLIEVLSKPGPLWDPANHPEPEGESVAWLSDADAVSDFAGVLARVRSGVRVVIQHEDQPVAVVHPTAPLRRTISECIALAKAHEEETGEAPTLEPDFAADVEAILEDREVWNPPSWE
jgi:antitoxin (DNA-binding transcriptional repressor) of toxin-antitoxin stability system